MREWLERRIQPHHRSRIRFEGPLPREQLRERLVRAAVCCFPSRWENFPNVCLEAMSLGVPVIGSDAGGMAEIIEDRRSGRIFPAGDVAALAQVLGEVFDASDREALGRAAIPRVTDYCDPRSLVTQFEQALARMVAPQPRTEASPRGATVAVVIPFYNLVPVPARRRSPRFAPRPSPRPTRSSSSTTVRSARTVCRCSRRRSQRDGVRVVRKPNGGRAPLGTPASPWRAGVGCSRSTRRFHRPDLRREDCRAFARTTASCTSTSLVSISSKDPEAPTGAGCRGSRP